MSAWLVAIVALPSAMWLIGLLLWRFRSAGRISAILPESAGVIVVARNEELTIAACLESLLQQSLRLDRIVLVDDGSTDRTSSVALAVLDKDSRIQIFSLPQVPRPISPKKEAIALAFGQLGTKHVLLTDADCQVPEKWASSLLGLMEAGTGAVIGASIPPAPSNMSDRIYRWERLIANTLMASACGWGTPASACGHSILYRSTALEEVNGPVRRDLRSGDDDLTVQAIARRGWKVKFCDMPESVVKDLGGARGSRWGQAGRHQSVVRFYPWYWRLLFALSILSNLAMLVFVATLPFADLTMPLWVVVICKCLFDALSGALLAQRLKVPISTPEILLASTLLPLWTVWRTATAFLSNKFEWRGRNAAPSNR